VLLGATPTAGAVITQARRTLDNVGRLVYVAPPFASTFGESCASRARAPVPLRPMLAEHVFLPTAGTTRSRARSGPRTCTSGQRSVPRDPSARTSRSDVAEVMYSETPRPLSLGGPDLENATKGPACKTKPQPWYLVIPHDNCPSRPDAERFMAKRMGPRRRMRSTIPQPAFIAQPVRVAGLHQERPLAG